MAERAVSRELRDIADGKVGTAAVTMMPVNPSDLAELRGIIMGPSGSPMEGYILFLNFSIPPDYPFKPPKVCFINRVWHPKVNERTGSVCLDALADAWRPDTTLETILVSIQCLLCDPGDLKNCLNGAAKEQYLEDRAAYVRTSRQWTEQDNEGYGRMTFSDYQVTAMQSLMKVPNAVKCKYYIFCSQESERTWKLVAVVVPNFSFYQQVPFEQYRRLTGFHFDFEEDEIFISFGDGTTRDKCWKITAVNALTFRKENVFSDPRKNSPAMCELQLEWLRDDSKPQRLIHNFSFMSSKSPDTPICSFDVCLDPVEFSRTLVAAVDVASNQPTLVKLLKFPLNSPACDGKEHMDVIQKIGPNYRKFGVLLLEDDTGSTVSSIISVMRENPEDINLEIVRRWLSGEGKQPITWETLVEVLRDCRLSSLAEIIAASTYHGSGPSIAHARSHNTANALQCVII